MKISSLMDRQRGLTLLEAMVTVAILAIVAGIGVPSYQALMERNRVTTVANDLLYHLQLARSEAVKRNRPAFLCPLNNDDDDDCSGTNTNWVDDWHVTSTDEDDDPIVIRVTQLPDGVTVTPSTNVTQVQFSAVGTVVGTRPDYFEVKVSNNHERHVCLRLSGAAEVIDPNDPVSPPPSC